MARWPAILLASALASGCATSGFVPTEEEIPALEERVESGTSDSDARVRLGAAYHQQGRLAEAEELLRPVVEDEPENADAVFFLGLVYEDQERPGEAIDLYQRYLESGAPGGLADRIEDRIPLLRRLELRLAVRDALEREAELADTRPEPRTVAVFPFLFAGGDERFRPLGRALAEMLTTDLSQTDRLAVLERVRVQVLLDEMALADSGRVDVATAARSGRLLGAGRIVQGQLQGSEDRIRIEAGVVDVAGGERAMAPVSQEDDVGGLARMQGELALRIYDALGITLTPAERERVGQSFTANIQALLAYGRGLEASDAGRYQEARGHFQEAVSLDPDFSRAAADGEEAAQLSEAQATGTDQLAQEGAQAALDLDISDEVDAMIREAGIRDPAQEVLGTEGVASSSAGSGTLIELIFRRPSGGIQ